jgi:hypothetical protein
MVVKKWVQESIGSHQGLTFKKLRENKLNSFSHEEGHDLLLEHLLKKLMN